MLYSNNCLQRVNIGSGVVDESQNVNEFLLAMLGASLALASLGAALQSAAAMFGSINAPLLAMLTKGNGKDDKKDDKNDDLVKKLEVLMKKGEISAEVIKKSDALTDEEKKVAENAMNQVKQQQTEASNKLENIAMFCRKQAQSGSAEEKAMLDKMCSALYDKDGNVVTGDKLKEVMDGPIGKEINEYTNSHREQMDKEGITVDGVLTEANKMSPSERARMNSENRIAAVNTHYKNERDAAEKEKNDKIAQLEKEKEDALKQEGANKEEIEERFKASKAQVEAEAKQKIDSISDAQKSSLNNAYDQCKKAEQMALDEEMRDKQNKATSDEEKNKIATEYADKKKKNEEDIESRRKASVDAVSAGSMTPAPPATNVPQEGETEPKSDDELKQELKDKYKDKSGDDVPEKFRGADGKFDASKVDALSGDDLKNAAKDAGISETKPKQQQQQGGGEPPQETEPKSDDELKQELKDKYKDKTGDDVPEALRGADGKLDPSKVDAMSSEDLKKAAKDAGISETKPKKKEGEPKNTGTKTKETFKDKDGTTYTKDGDKYTKRTKDGVETEISADDFENQKKAVRKEIKTDGGKKYPVVDDDGDETGEYVVKKDDGTYEKQDKDGKKTGDATENDFNDAKQTYNDEYEETEHDAEDNEEGDDEYDDDNGKKMKNPAKEWHHKKNKRTGKTTKSYYNKEGDSISQQEFKEKLAKYREKKRAAAGQRNESHRITAKSLTQYIYERMHR